tara:strand:- start:1929 stop:2561 length:633 start_codon:yes stop_codon:yes gene_type:complete
VAAPKGSNNARAYQDAIKAKNRALVEDELGRLKESRAIFNSITALSQAVAKRTGLTDYTLRRNKEYRFLITKYITEQRGRSGYVSRAETELTILRHEITKLELRLSNISEDNNRLRAHLKKMKNAEGTEPKLGYTIPANSSGNSQTQDIQRAYYLIQAILSRADFLVNFEKNTIEDITGFGDEEIVAGENLAKPYLEWVRSKSLNDDRSL